MIKRGLLSYFNELKPADRQKAIDYILSMFNQGDYIAELPPPEPERKLEIKTVKQGNIITPHPATWGRTATL